MLVSWNEKRGCIQRFQRLKSDRADITLSISSGSSTPGRARHFAMINYGHGIAKGRRGKVQGTLHFGYGSRARGWYRLNRNKMFNCTPSFLDAIFSSFLSLSLSLPVTSSRYVVSSYREKKVYPSIFPSAWPTSRRRIPSFVLERIESGRVFS